MSEDIFFFVGDVCIYPYALVIMSAESRMYDSAQVSETKSLIHAIHAILIIFLHDMFFIIPRNFPSGVGVYFKGPLNSSSQHQNSESLPGDQGILFTYFASKGLFLGARVESSFVARVARVALFENMVDGHHRRARDEYRPIVTLTLTLSLSHPINHCLALQ